VKLAEVDGVGDSSNLKFCTKKNRQQKPKFVSELLAKKIYSRGLYVTIKCVPSAAAPFIFLGRGSI